MILTQVKALGLVPGTHPREQGFTTEMKSYGIRAIFGIAIGMFIWGLMFSDEYDAKNLHYIGWKFHVLPMDPMRALNTMHQDNPLPLVVGKTRAELEHRFGFVRTGNEVRPYLVDYCAASRPGKNVLFLNNSDWMVVMEGGKVSDLVYCKG